MTAVSERGRRMAEYIEREAVLELYQIDDPVLNETGHVPLPVIRQNILDMPAADVVPKAENDALKQLIKGEWVDCDAVQKALGIDFATGMKMFDFSRTAEWNPKPLNGQKITTKFRLKNTVVHGRWEWREEWETHHETHSIDLISCGWYCTECGVELGEYLTEKTGQRIILDDDCCKPKLTRCPNCGAKMDAEGGEG